MFLFAILFGLSMDYEVFLVSRMHEEWVKTRNNRRAVTVGQGETGEEDVHQRATQGDDAHQPRRQISHHPGRPAG